MMVLIVSNIMFVAGWYCHANKEELMAKVKELWDKVVSKVTGK